jgi:cobyrinic acid a,c-diamide synthase
VWDSTSAHEFQKQQPPGLDAALHGSTDALAAALLGMSADAQLALVRARGGLFDDGGSSIGGTADGASSSGSGDVGASSSAGGGSDSDGETPNDGTEGGAGLQRLSSAAHVAQALHAPLVLVVDGSTFASVRAVVALLKGCSALLHGTCIGGLLLNRSGCSATAPRQLRRAMDAAGLRGTVLLGGLPKLESDAMSDEQQLATAAATHVDLLALQALAARAAVPTPAAPLLLPPARSYRAAVGLAMDAAFYRYFQQ